METEDDLAGLDASTIAVMLESLGGAIHAVAFVEESVEGRCAPVSMEVWRELGRTVSQLAVALQKRLKED